MAHTTSQMRFVPHRPVLRKRVSVERYDAVHAGNAGVHMQLIAKDDAAAALRCIRQRLQPLRVYQDELHSLTGSVLCGSVDNGEIREVWLGTAGLGKKTVLERLRVRPVPCLGLIKLQFCLQRMLN